MRELEYPFDSEFILRKKKRIKRSLLENNDGFIDKKVAILGGSTTSEIKNIIELFLLNNGIRPSFYESEYNKYYEDAVFGNNELSEFAPDIVFVHTTNRNIINYPNTGDSKEIVDKKLQSEYIRFETIWTSLRSRFGCAVIQNNFDYPDYRLLGNKDATDYRGKVNYVTRLNLKFAEYAESNDGFYINDINYQSSQFGLEKWSDPSYWHLYKYALAVPAIPTLAFNIANIIKAMYGKNKKALVLDLDNTLWGGIVGDDGVENLSIGLETAEGAAYTEFQKYIQEHKQMGVLLAVDSKNEIENAIAGLSHPDSVLSKDDFLVIKANWDPKSKNLFEISKELNIGLDSCVFVDDNPAERELVSQQLCSVSAPNIGDNPEYYFRVLDRSGFFECVNLSSDDLEKSQMYRQNAKRNELMNSFDNYDDYLKSLKMKAEIKPFSRVYLQRIAQLTNKSNQFNLTTKRYTVSEIESVASDDNYITLYGRLYDKFGDNGVVAVSIGRIVDSCVEIDLWLMSCRVLKRDFEIAMMDAFVKCAAEKNIKTIYGYYFPTKKNNMVKHFFESFGYKKVYEEESGNSKWEITVDSYKYRNRFISLEE